MRVIADTRLIEGRVKLASRLGLGSLAVLVAGMVLSFVIGVQVIQFTVGGTLVQLDTFMVSWFLLLIGFMLSQAALYLGNRYGNALRRPDVLIDSELRALDDRYVALHHVPGAPSHMLLTPLGAYALDVKHQGGLVRYRNGRWEHHLPLKLLRSLLAAEGLGNPARDSGIELAQLNDVLKKKNLENALPVHSLIVFVNPDTRVEADESPVPAVHVQKLKGYLRSAESATPERVSKATLMSVAEALSNGIPDAPAPKPSEVETADAAPSRPARRKRRAVTKGGGKGKRA